jgi:phage-related protein
MIDRRKKLPAWFYVNPAGRIRSGSGFWNWPTRIRRTIGKDIQKVEFGCPIGRPHCAPLSHGLWEVRSDLDRNMIARVIFCIDGGRMILLHGFVKKTQKVAHSDIELARKRKREVTWWKRKTRLSVSQETFDEFLSAQGIVLEAAMQEQGLTKSEMAARMKTSRRQLDRLFDPSIPSVTLDTLRRAASAVGRTLRIELV